ncbi:MAG TPA: hypothetical protein VGJ60_36510 [Chloroflexota bacterium]
MTTAINAYDLDASAALFSDDAVVIEPHIAGLPELYVGSTQIRWWLRNLFAQHVHLAMRREPRAGAPDIPFSEMFSVDAYRQLGLTEVMIESDVVLDVDSRISSLSMTLSPDAARAIQGAPAVEPEVRTNASLAVPVDMTDLSGALLIFVSFSLGVVAALVTPRLTRGYLVGHTERPVGALLERARGRRA